MGSGGEGGGGWCWHCVGSVGCKLAVLAELKQFSFFITLFGGGSLADIFKRD